MKIKIVNRYRQTQCIRVEFCPFIVWMVDSKFKVLTFEWLGIAVVFRYTKK